VVMPDQKTEVIGPTAEAHRRKGWRGMFRSGDRNNQLAHH